jgi:Domain of unknown function (DUF1330)
MAGYLIVRIKVKDPKSYEEYKKLAQEAVAKHGGRYLVRGGRTETLEILSLAGISTGDCKTQECCDGAICCRGRRMKKSMK